MGNSRVLLDPDASEIGRQLLAGKRACGVLRQKHGGGLAVLVDTESTTHLDDALGQVVKVVIDHVDNRDGELGDNPVIVQHRALAGLKMLADPSRGRKMRLKGGYSSADGLYYVQLREQSRGKRFQDGRPEARTKRWMDALRLRSCPSAA